MKLIKFIVKENIKEGYSLGMQLFDGLAMIIVVLACIYMLG